MLGTGNSPAKTNPDSRKMQTHPQRVSVFAPRVGSYVPVIDKPYCRFFIKVSSADFGGRVNSSGSVASGSSTMLNWSINVGFCVSI